jgi:predicted ATPase
LDHSSVQARTVVAQALWIQGLMDQSAQTIRDVLADAVAGDHIVSLGFTFVWCIFVTSLGGDLEAVAGLITRLEYHAQKHDLTSYYACCLGFQGLLSAKRGEFTAAERLLRDCLRGLRQSRYEVVYAWFLTSLAGVLVDAGQASDSLAVIDEAQEYAERSDTLWLMPEIIRVKGEVLLVVESADTPSAEEHFRRSLNLARRQGALSWELRSAMSLGQLHSAQGRKKDAGALLNFVYAKFTEGFETAELRHARRILDEWI